MSQRFLHETKGLVKGFREIYSYRRIGSRLVIHSIEIFRHNFHDINMLKVWKTKLKMVTGRSDFFVTFSLSKVRTSPLIPHFS